MGLRQSKARKRIVPCESILVGPHQQILPSEEQIRRRRIWSSKVSPEPSSGKILSIMLCATCTAVVAL